MTDPNPTPTPTPTPNPIPNPAKPRPKPDWGGASAARVVIERVEPIVDEGFHAIKRVSGESVRVVSHVFADGHDQLAVRLRHRHESDPTWTEIPMRLLGNDEWEAVFVVDRLGDHEYQVVAWIDEFATWRDGLAKKAEAGLDVSLELREGAILLADAADRLREAPSAPDRDSRAAAERLRALADALVQPPAQVDPLAVARGPELAALADAAPPARGVVETFPLRVQVERLRARFGTWYELFPRSFPAEPGRHGTLRDLVAQLPRIADMGFDVLYLPPIHPVGRAFRKGPNNALEAGPDDPGSPWAIGSEEGGHDAIHPALGTFEDFAALVAAAEARGIEIALDVAFQCSPDHPWIKQHPEWFRRRPDGSIKYAENPPKKYQDIHPLDFETDRWRELWIALRDVFLFWIDRGVKIFRVDNPHTKPFRFWEWVIREIRRVEPGVILLSEAFTRPKPMKNLAKRGFSQSYTYFTWRNSKAELVEYFTELNATECREYMRPNLFANTPDILHEFLQTGGPPAFRLRYLLAGTLGANCGVYGPVYERCVGTPVRPGSEEYLDSEKYQIRDWSQPPEPEHDISPLIARVNAARRAHPALQSDHSLAFHSANHDALLAYSKIDTATGDAVLVVANLDPRNVVEGHAEIPAWRFGLPADAPFRVRDLLSDAEYEWRDGPNYVRLDPAVAPAHLFHILR